MLCGVFIRSRLGRLLCVRLCTEGFISFLRQPDKVAATLILQIRKPRLVGVGRDVQFSSVQGHTARKWPRLGLRSTSVPPQNLDQPSQQTFPLCPRPWLRPLDSAGRAGGPQSASPWAASGRRILSLDLMPWSGCLGLGVRWLALLGCDPLCAGFWGESSEGSSWSLLSQVFGPLAVAATSYRGNGTHRQPTVLWKLVSGFRSKILDCSEKKT